MPYPVRDRQLYKNYPFWTRLEWHLSRSKYVAFAIDALIHKPRRWWYERNSGSHALARFESSVYSQNGEDGIIQEIFNRIGEGERFALEFGIGNGEECCTRNLFVNHNWHGAMIEACSHYARNAQRVYKDYPVKISHNYVTLENVFDLFKELQIPETPDLLVIDIDGNDYWIWEKILTGYRPRVVVIEYNARFPPPVEWVMPYDTDYEWDGSSYFGASLASLVKLGEANGYSLVACDSRGVNAFFVRSELVKNHFSDAGLKLYSTPVYGRGFGQPVRMRTKRFS